MYERHNTAVGERHYQADFGYYEEIADDGLTIASAVVTSDPAGLIFGTPTIIDGPTYAASVVNVPIKTRRVTAGVYTVRVAATLSDGKTVAMWTSQLRVTGPAVPTLVPVVASFSADVSSGEPSLAVTFTDASTGPVTAWAWDFGDGETSTSQNPTHAYAAAGTYTPTLTVSSDDSTDTVTGATITVLPADLLGFNRLAGYPGKVRPALAGSPFVDVHGTVTTGAGRLGPCAVFDGASVGAVGLGGGYDLGAMTGDWTIAVDFYFSAFPTPGTQANLIWINYAANGVNQLTVYLGQTGGLLGYVQAIIQTTSHGQQTLNPAVGSFTPGWYTAVLRYNSATAVYTLDYSGKTASTAALSKIVTNATQFNNLMLGGRWTSVAGWGQFFTGKMENLRCYNRRLSDVEVTAISVGTDPSSPPAATQILLAEPQAYQVHQRNGSNTATLRISGCLRGAAQTLTDLQWSWNGTAWADLSATVDDTNRTFTGTATLTPAAATPAGRQGTLKVRLKNNTAIATAVDHIGIGDVFAIWGQSNAAGAYTNAQPYAPTNGLKAAVFGFDYRVRSCAESAVAALGGNTANGGNTHASGGYAWVDGGSENYSAGSLWPRVMALRADSTGYPQMVVPGAVAGSSISAVSSTIGGWGPTSGARRNGISIPYIALKRRAVYVPGGVKLWIGMQGEQDATPMSKADYKTYLKALADALAADCPGIKLANSLLHMPSSGYWSLADATKIREAITESASEDANVLVGADLSDLTCSSGPHFVLDAEAVTVAARWDARLTALGY